MSELKVNKISPQSGTAFTLGDSGDTFTVPSGATLTVAGTFTQTGTQTFDGGVDIDNFNINGTTIALSSGDMTLDVAGDIILDAAGEQIRFHDAGTLKGFISMDSDNITLKSETSDKDIIFQGNDGGAAITALTLDMSAAGAATFNNNVTVGDNLNMTTDASVINFGADSDVILTHVADTGLLLNAAMVVQFRDAAINIGSPADGDLDINADDEIELNSTLIDINGAVDISGALTIGGVTSIPDGSGGSPSLTNTGDTNTGLFFGAADHLTVTTGGNTHTTFTGNAAPQTINVSASGGGDMVKLIGPGSGTAAVVQVIGHEARGSSVEFFQDQGDDNADKWVIGNGAQFFGVATVAAQESFYFTDTDGGSTDNEAKLEHSGAWSTEGAQNASTTVDYAEFFEWKTALANDDKITETYGMTVVLDGDKVRLAETGEEAKVLGVIRPNGTSAMVGGSHTFKWKDKYETDVWGVIEKENYTQVTWIEDTTRHSYPKDRIPSGITPPSSDEEKTAKQYTERNKYRKDKGSHKKDDLLMRKKLNSSYDESKAYVDRENRRKEWAIVGLLGQVPIRSTAIVPTHYTKMKNIETGIDLYYIK